MNKFFGAKGLFQSMTAWGGMLLAAAQSIPALLVSGGVMDQSSADSMKAIVESAGTLFLILGGRRALGEMNGSPSSEK